MRDMDVAILTELKKILPDTDTRSSEEEPKQETKSRRSKK